MATRSQEVKQLSSTTGGFASFTRIQSTTPFSGTFMPFVDVSTPWPMLHQRPLRMRWPATSIAHCHASPTGSGPLATHVQAACAQRHSRQPQTARSPAGNAWSWLHASAAFCPSARAPAGGGLGPCSCNCESQRSRVPHVLRAACRGRMLQLHRSVRALAIACNNMCTCCN